MSVVRGAMGPLLEKTIRDELSYEHQVVEGKAERKTVRWLTLYTLPACNSACSASYVT